MDETQVSRTSPLSQGRLPPPDHQISEARMLATRLERLSADSYWAHQASGLRGALLRSITLSESLQVAPSNQAGETASATQLDSLMRRSFEILVRAAREIHR